MFVVGNVVREAAQFIKGRRPLDSALSDLCRSDKAWRTVHSITGTVPEWTSANLHIDDAIFLTGKAAATRIALGFGLKLAEEAARNREGSDHEALRLGTVRASPRLFLLLASASEQLARSATDPVLATSSLRFRCVLSYTLLARSVLLRWRAACRRGLHLP